MGVHRRLVVVGSLLVAATVLGIETAAALPDVGAAAPDFALKSDDGRNIRLSELRGQVVLINFWASWCVPCARELPLLDKIYAQYRAAGFMLLGVNVDSTAKRRDAEEMMKRLNVRFPVLFDPNQAVVARYQDGREKGAMPLTLIVDRDGRVRHVHLGYFNGYEKKYEQQVRDLLKQ